jgi:4-hydroxy-tetrahydrodipicolinate reductase
MGRAVISEADARGHEIVVAVNRTPDTEAVAGVPVAPSQDLEAMLAAEEPDALVDFTGPEASVAYVRAAADLDVPAVVGTTGFSEEQGEALLEASKEIPLLRAANFSRGVQALERAVTAALSALADYDVELTETHHNAKTDAPSGTAKELLAAIDAELGGAKRVHGREGDAPREEGDIGVHARRAGDITGEHEVLLAGNDEVLTLEHRAESRGVFAAGALDAAEWLADESPGFYGFEDVLDGQ